MGMYVSIVLWMEIVSLSISFRFPSTDVLLFSTAVLSSIPFTRSFVSHSMPFVSFVAFDTFATGFELALRCCSCIKLTWNWSYALFMLLNEKNNERKRTKNESSVKFLSQFIADHDESTGKPTNWSKPVQNVFWTLVWTISRYGWMRVWWCSKNELFADWTMQACSPSRSASQTTPFFRFWFYWTENYEFFFFNLLWVRFDCKYILLKEW